MGISGNFHLSGFWNFAVFDTDHINGFVQDCIFSIANALLEILQSCTKPSIYDVEENFVQIHLPGWQFYLPRAIGQWDISSPDTLWDIILHCCALVTWLSYVIMVGADALVPNRHHAISNYHADLVCESSVTWFISHDIHTISHKSHWTTGEMSLSQHLCDWSVPLLLSTIYGSSECSNSVTKLFPDTDQWVRASYTLLLCHYCLDLDGVSVLFTFQEMNLNLNLQSWLLVVCCCSGLGVTKQKSMLNSMLVDKDFLTWLLIGWRLCCQPIRCQVWKFLLTNMDFNMEIS